MTAQMVTGEKDCAAPKIKDGLGLPSPYGSIVFSFIHVLKRPSALLHVLETVEHLRENRIAALIT